ncbi:MAG: YitT family protein [Clostridia bacterium]|nr:YitT family protein [Clostridia bacterium]
MKSFFNVKFLFACLFITLISFISAFAIYFFIVPASFAPIGLEGVATMLFSVLDEKVNLGLINIILNAPLLVLAYFKLDKKYVLYVILFSVLNSLFLSLLEVVNAPQYISQDQSGRIIASIFAGVMLGARAGYMYKLGASTGGVEIVANVVQKKYPFLNCERIVSALCIALMGLSYFVYDELTSILLSIIHLFIYEKAVTFVLRDSREAIEVKIITKNPDELHDDIVNELGHSATIVKSKGMYSGDDNAIVFVLISRRQLAQFVKIIKKYPNTFIYYTEVQGVFGKFRQSKNQPIEIKRGQL